VRLKIFHGSFFSTRVNSIQNNHMNVFVWIRKKDFFFFYSKKIINLKNWLFHYYNEKIKFFTSYEWSKYEVLILWFQKTNFIEEEPVFTKKIYVTLPSTVISWVPKWILSARFLKDAFKLETSPFGSLKELV
jgi:hypothetical protein